MMAEKDRFVADYTYVTRCAMQDAYHEARMRTATLGCDVRMRIALHILASLKRDFAEARLCRSATLPKRDFAEAY